jgi:hypothetical protein
MPEWCTTGWSLCQTHHEYVHFVQAVNFWLKVVGQLRVMAAADGTHG